MQFQKSQAHKILDKKAVVQTSSNVSAANILPKFIFFDIIGDWANCFTFFLFFLYITFFTVLTSSIVNNQK